jgi:DNA-binding transcriptional ArsR family regulator
MSMAERTGANTAASGEVVRRSLAEEGIARAWTHPIRVKAFRLLADGVLSPVEIARLIGEPIHKVGYHVHQLEEFGLVELVGKRQVRGATQHFYRAIERPAMDDGEWAALDIEERRAVSRYGLQLIFGDATMADETGTLDERTDRHLSRVPQQVDEAGYEELRQIHEEALERILAVQERVAARRAEDQSAETFPVISSQLFFTMPSERRQPAGGS